MQPRGPKVCGFDMKLVEASLDPEGNLVLIFKPKTKEFSERLAKTLRVLRGCLLSVEIYYRTPKPQ